MIDVAYLRKTDLASSFVHLFIPYTCSAVWTLFNRTSRNTIPMIGSSHDTTVLQLPALDLVRQRLLRRPGCALEQMLLIQQLIRSDG